LQIWIRAFGVRRDEQIVATVQARLQFAGVIFRYCTLESGALSRDAAEFLVIDELFMVRCSPAHRAIGIFAQLQLANFMARASKRAASGEISPLREQLDRSMA